MEKSNKKTIYIIIGVVLFVVAVPVVLAILGFLGGAVYFMNSGK